MMMSQIAVSAHVQWKYISENCLNTVKVPKFAAVNGESWSLRTMVVKIYGSVAGWHDFAHTQRAVWSLTQRRTLFWRITPFIFIVAPKKLYREQANRDQEFQICGKNLPLCIGHEIWRMRSGCKRIVNDILREMSELNSRTDTRRIFKLGGSPDHVTRRVWSLTMVKRSKVKVT